MNELDRVTAWLNLVMGAVTSGVLAVDGTARITTCNAAASALLRGVLREAVGADYRALFPDSPLLRVLSCSELVAGYERTVRGPDGDRRILAAKSTALHAADGAVIGAVEVLEDVTEVRRLRESVERADRLKQLGEMAAGVAHEIRNPLNGIAGFASLLARDLPADDHRHRYASAIQEGVLTLNRTVTALLAFTSPKAPPRRQADSAALAQGCLRLVRAELCLRADEGTARRRAHPGRPLGRRHHGARRPPAPAGAALPGAERAWRTWGWLLALSTLSLVTQLMRSLFANQ